MTDRSVVVVPAVALKPGDKVLLNFGTGDLEPEDMREVKDELAERFPEVEFVVLYGIEQITVQEATS